MGGRTGICIDRPDGSAEEIVAALFSESSGRIVLEVTPERADELCARTNAVVIGRVTEEERLVWRIGDRPLIDVSLEQLLHAWRGHVVDARMLTSGASGGSE